MTSSVTALDASRLERAHYQLQRGQYFTDVVEIDGATAFGADGITEPEWNHAALLHAADPGATLAVLLRIENFFEGRGLAPAVELGPGTRAPGLVRHLRDRGYEPGYRYAWLTPDGSPPDRPPEASGEVQISQVRMQHEAEAFFSVFRATYPDGLDPGYERALARLASSSAAHRVEHYLARIGDRPVAVASSIHGLEGDAKGITGLYNLAVHPDWRRRGLGGLLTRHRVDRARALGHQAFLQTERESVESWQRRHGFRHAFVTAGWVRSRPPQNPESNDPCEDNT